MFRENEQVIEQKTIRNAGQEVNRNPSPMTDNTTFRYHNFVPRTKVFGLDDRPRAMLWFQGCSHHPHCKGCMSQETWSAAEGREMSVGHMVDRILRTSDIAGIVLSGGEVFDQPEALLALLKTLKERSERDLDVMIYTGFTFRELIHMENEAVHEVLAKYTDVLVDGRYVDELNDGNPLRGSSNQEILLLSNRYCPTDLERCMERKCRQSNPRKVEFHFNDGHLVLVGIPEKEELKRISTFFSQPCRHER